MAQEGIGGFLSVSTTPPATVDLAGLAAVADYEDIEKGGDVPEFGAVHATVEFTPLKTGITEKAHGAINYGSFDYPMAYDTSDAGQVILEEVTDPDHADYKTTLSCRETRSDGTLRYFLAKIMSYQTGASVSGVITATSRFEVTSKVWTAPATP